MVACGNSFLSTFQHEADADFDGEPGRGRFVEVFPAYAAGYVVDQIIMRIQKGGGGAAPEFQVFADIADGATTLDLTPVLKLPSTEASVIVSGIDMTFARGDVVRIVTNGVVAGAPDALVWARLYVRGL